MEVSLYFFVQLSSKIDWGQPPKFILMVNTDYVFPACLYLHKVKRLREGNKGTKSAANSLAASLLTVSSGNVFGK